MLTMIFILLAVFIDFFIGSGALNAVPLHIGFVIILNLIKSNKIDLALYSSITYGLLLDVLWLGMPFGTFVIAHLLVWAVLVRLKDVFHGSDVIRKWVSMFIALVFYSLIIYSIEFFSVNIFTNMNTLFTISIFWIISKSIIATLVLVYMYTKFTNFIRTLIKKWFYISAYAK